MLRFCFKNILVRVYESKSCHDLIRMFKSNIKTPGCDNNLLNFSTDRFSELVPRLMISCYMTEHNSCPCVLCALIKWLLRCLDQMVIKLVYHDTTCKDNTSSNRTYNAWSINHKPRGCFFFYALNIKCV